MEKLAKTIQICYDAKVNVAFWGRHGIGKTAVIEQLANEGYFVKTIILSQSDPLVLGGMPRSADVHASEKEFVDDGQKSIFATPLWLIELRKAAKSGLKPIVFLDEFNRADKYAHNAAMRLVNEGEICGHKVPKNTLFVMAMNPETASDADINPLNDPLINRMAHIAVYSNMGIWMQWAKGDGKVNSAVTGFIQAKSERLNGFSMENLFETQILNRIKPTERSVAAVGRICDAIAKGEELQATMLKGVAYNLISGLCGSEWAKEFVAHVEDSYVKPFTLEEMLAPTKGTVAKLNKLKDNGQTQVIIASLDNAREKFAEKNLSAKELKKFWSFLEACPKDIQSAFWSSDMTNASKTKIMQYWNQMLSGDLPEGLYAALQK